MQKRGSLTHRSVFFSEATKTKSASGSDEWTTTTYDVKLIIVHQDYGKSKSRTWDNDIALIGLKRPVPKYIEPASMANVGDKLSNCKAAGRCHFRKVLNYHIVSG